MHWISPLARAGFRMLAASMAPSAAPAPMRVCISSINRMMERSFFSSCITFFMRSSNSPRYLAPASIPARSSVTMRLSPSSSGTAPSTIFCAKPSATALLPTPGSPMSTGLFLVLRERICTMRSISSSLPMTGSSSPFFAASVRSLPYCISVGADSSSLAEAALSGSLPSTAPAFCSCGWLCFPNSLRVASIILL